MYRLCVPLQDGTYDFVVAPYFSAASGVNLIFDEEQSEMSEVNECGMVERGSGEMNGRG